MNTLDWILVGLVLLGIAPAWLIGIAAFIAARTRKTGAEKPSARYSAYVGLLDSLHQAMKTGTVENGPIYITGIRELRAYPEYRDITLLYLEEINVNGSGKFDQIMNAELKATEAFFLDAKHD